MLLPSALIIYHSKYSQFSSMPNMQCCDFTFYNLGSGQTSKLIMYVEDTKEDRLIDFLF